MLLTGVLYLVFEKRIMAKSTSARKDLSIDGMSRLIMGVQVCSSIFYSPLSLTLRKGRLDCSGNDCHEV